MVLGGKPVRFRDAKQCTLELGLERVGHGEVAYDTAPRTHEVVVMAFGECLVELVPRVLVRRDDAMHHAGVFEHDEVAVRGGHRKPVVARDDLGDGERRIGRGEHLDQRLTAARVTLVGVTKALGREMVRIGSGHRAMVAN